MTELLIVSTLLSLIVTLALPSYLGITLRVNRTNALSDLVSAAACQEKHRAAAGSYDTSKCKPVQNGNYRYEYEPQATAGLTTFSIRAVPLGRQLKDKCGSLTLDHLGRRSIGTAAGTNRCWSGR